MWFEITVEVAAEDSGKAVTKGKKLATDMLNTEKYKLGLGTEVNESSFGYFVSFKIDLIEEEK